jgi:hypothetical protein
MCYEPFTVAASESLKLCMLHRQVNAVHQIVHQGCPLLLVMGNLDEQ